MTASEKSVILREQIVAVQDSSATHLEVVLLLRQLRVELFKMVMIVLLEFLILI